MVIIDKLKCTTKANQSKDNQCVPVSLKANATRFMEYSHIFRVIRIFIISLHYFFFSLSPSSETRSRLIPGPAAMPFQLQYARVNHCSAGRMHGVPGVIIPHALVSNFRGFATYKCTGWFEPMDMYGRKHLRKANRNI